MSNCDRKFDFVKKSMEDSSFVFHLASRAYGIGYSRNNHVQTLLHNEKITNNLINVFSTNKPKKILIVSSSCIYSDNGPDIISEDENFTSLSDSEREFFLFFIYFEKGPVNLIISF